MDNRMQPVQAILNTQRLKQWVVSRERDALEVISVVTSRSLAHTLGAPSVVTEIATALH